MKKLELRQLIKEEIQKLKILREYLLKEEFSQNVINLHFAKDKKEKDMMFKQLRSAANWSKSDTDYMLKKLRKAVNYKGPDIYDPAYYDEADLKYQKFDDRYAPNYISNNRDKLAKEKEKAAKKQAQKEKRANAWNKRKYEKWVKEMAHWEDNGTDERPPSDFGRDMANNAPQDLIDYIERQIEKSHRSETPLERIQWDIEAEVDW